MVNAFLALLSGLVAFLVAHLPASPIASLVLGGDGLAGSGIPISTILGWVNWIVPIKSCLQLFTAWVAACLLFTAVNWVVRRFLNQVPVITDARSL